MKKSEMDKLREFVEYLKTYDTFCKSPACRLTVILDTFEVEEEPVQPEPDRNIRVADFIEITPINGRKFIA